MSTHQQHQVDQSMSSFDQGYEPHHAMSMPKHGESSTKKVKIHRNTICTVWASTTHNLVLHLTSNKSILMK